MLMALNMTHICQPYHVILCNGAERETARTEKILIAVIMLFLTLHLFNKKTDIQGRINNKTCNGRKT
jgi:hypothetical protein